MEVHSRLGPGLLESVYEECLCHELTRTGLPFKRQVSMPVRYRDLNLDAGLRMDLVVDERAILEIKSISQLQAIHQSQLYTYLRLSGIRLGLLINFNVRHLRHGIVRKVF
jgi:GxxExxY protein